MRSPQLADLPPPPAGRSGWPWTEASPPAPTLPNGSSWPRISLVTATFRRARYLEETLRSVLLQGYPDLEYFVLDGDSHDGTVEILERYAPWLAGWTSEPDTGQWDAVNRGLDRASGDLVTFLSSDDLYLPGTFHDVAARWAELRGRGYGAIVGGFRNMGADSRLWKEPYVPPRLPHEGPLDLSLVPPGNWRLHQEATFYLRPALDAVGRRLREDLVYNADRELLYRLLRAFPACLVDRPYAAFRNHEGGLAGGPAGRYPATLEYARLQLSYCDLRDGHERVRRRIARHFLAKAEVTFARYSERRGAAAAALLKALRHEPQRLASRGYWKLWLRVFGLLPHLRRRATREAAAS